jgi:alpha-L-fucosidase 2
LIVQKAALHGSCLRFKKFFRQKVKNMAAKQLHGSTYQTIGNLNLSFPQHDNYINYYRELDLEKALFTTKYTVGNLDY